MAEPPDVSLFDQLRKLGRIDATCDQFEREWVSGKSPRIEEYLTRCGDAERAAVFSALLEVEFELLHGAGLRPDPEQYRRRFPEWTHVVQLALVQWTAESQQVAAPAAQDTATVLEADVATSQVGAAAPQSSAARARPDRIGRFEVLAVLGEGAFGTVYQARDPHLNREVAIKVPHEEVLTCDAERKRFLREAKVAATLNHPHICPVYEVGQSEDHSYIVMGLIEGRTLAEQIKSGNRLTLREAITVVRRIALAMAEAHAKGIVHRDLKPANIMLNRRGEPIVMDFGLARLHEAGDAGLTHTGVIMGSPAYMSPEQARGVPSEIGPESDIFSSGVILYELLSGQRPFQGSVAEVIGQVLHVDPLPPSHFDASIEPALETICLKAIAKTKADRYRSMSDLAADLNVYLKASFTAGLDPPSASLASRPAATGSRPPAELGRQRRSWRAVVFVALLLLVAVAGTVVVRMQTDRGTLVVAVDDPQIEARLRSDGVIIHDEAHRRSYTIRADGAHAFRSGTYRLAGQQPFQLMVLDDAGLEVGTDEFMLRRGDEVRVRVTLEARSPPLEQPLALSPLDQLDARNIPASDRLPWQPPELVAVYGDHRGTHWGAIRALALSPDGAMLASASDDATIGIWDASTLNSLGYLLGHQGPVHWITFTPTGDQLLSAGQDGSVRLWELERRREIRRFPGHAGAVRCVVVHPGGQQALSCGDDGTIRLWDLSTGEHLRTFDKHTSAVWRICLTADGERVLSGSDDRTMRFWDLKTGKDLVAFENQRPGPVQYRAIALSPDGTRAACGWSEGERNFATMRLFDTASGKEVFRARDVKHFGHGMDGIVHPGSQIFSADGKELLSGAHSPADGNSLLLRDASTGQLKRKMGEQATLATAVLLSHDGKRAFSGSRYGRIRMWDVESGKDLRPPTGHESFVTSVAFSPDGRSLLSAGEDLSVRHWDTLSGKQQVHRAAHPGMAYSAPWRAQFAAGGAMALLSGGDYTVDRAELWDVTSWRLMQAFHKRWNESVYSIAASRDGRQILAGLQGALRLWDSAHPDQPRRLPGHAGACTSIAFFPDGRRAVTGGADKFVRLWDLESGEEVRRIGPLPGRTCCIVSPDGRAVAVACASDGSLRVYDAELQDEPQLIDAAPIPNFEGLPQCAAAFSPDSKAFALATMHGEIMIWNLTHRRQQRVIKLPGLVYHLTFDATGRYLATANYNGAVYLLRLSYPDGTIPSVTSWERPAEVPEPAAHWDFDEADSTLFIDTIGTVPDGRAGGMRRQLGVVGKALQIEGSEPRIPLGKGGQPRMVFRSAMSLAAWVRPETRGSGDIVRRIAGYTLSRQERQFQFTIHLMGRGWSVAAPVAARDTAERWTHLVGVFDGDLVQLYMNGQLVQTSRVSEQSTAIKHPQAADLKPPFTMFQVDSGWPHEVGGGYRGLLDEIQVFDLALSPEQVASLFRSYRPAGEVSLPAPRP